MYLPLWIVRMTETEGRQVLGLLRAKLARYRSHPMYDDLHGYVLLRVCRAWEHYQARPVEDRWRLARHIIRAAPASFWYSQECDLAFRPVSGRGHPLPRPVSWEELEEEGAAPWYQRPRTPDFAPALVERLWRQWLVEAIRPALPPEEQTMLAAYLREVPLSQAAGAAGVSPYVAHRRLEAALNRYRAFLGLPLIHRYAGQTAAWYERRRAQEGRPKGPQRGRPNSTKSHCGHGHPFSGMNLQVDPHGRWHCRACKQEENRRSKARWKEKQAARQEEKASGAAKEG